jgi:hypothetical protein
VTVVVAALLVLAAACGDDGASTGNEAPGATVSGDPGAGVGSGFCDQLAAQDEVEFDAFSPSSAEAGLRASVDALRRARSAAPSPIRADMEILVDHAERLLALLEGHGFDLMAVSASEMAAINTDSVAAASERIAAFCGIDDDGSAEAPATPIDPEGAFEALMPPGGRLSSSPAEHMMIAVTDVSFDEVIDHYRTLTGPELSLAGAEGFRLATFISGHGSPLGFATITVSDQPSGPVEVVIALAP